MTFDLNIPAALFGAALTALAIGIKRDNGWIIFPAFIVAFVSAIVWIETSDWKQAERKAEAEAARRAAIPHVIREADGCKVYAFTAGGKEHYFTRCADAVTTDRNYDVKVNCGKGCTRTEHHIETIVTKKATP